MKKLFVSMVILSVLVLSATALGQKDSGLDAKVSAVTGVVPMKAATSQPVAAETRPSPLPGTKPPTSIEEGIGEAQTFIGAIKAKAWWLVAASGIFIAMLLLQIFGLFEKMGKRATWIVAGVMYFAAALLLAFDAKGFGWNTFLGFCTAGPTVAWVRGFVKKAVLNKSGKKEGA